MMNVASKDGRAGRLALLWTLVALAVYLFFFLTSFRAIGAISDAAEYAATARSIARGEGAISGFLQPVNFSDLEPGQIREASGRIGPTTQYLWPLALSLVFRLFGASDAASALCCGLFYVACVPLAFLLALRIFDERAAHIAAALCALNERALYYSISGMSESMFIFLLLLLAHLLISSGGTLRGLAAGLTAGLIFFSREIGPLFALPWLPLILIGSERRWRRALGLLLGLGLIILANMAVRPMMLHHWDGHTRARVQSEAPQPDQSTAPTVEPAGEGGAPAKETRRMNLVERYLVRKFGAVMFAHSPLYPGHSYARGLERADVENTVSLNIDAFVYRAKEISLPILLRTWFWRASNPILLWSFWLAPLLAIRSRRQLWPWLAVVGGLAISGAVLLVVFVMERYIHPAVPLMLVFSAGAFSRLLGAVKPWAARPLAVLLVLAATYPWGVLAGIDRSGLVSPKDCRALASVDPRYYRDLGGIVKGDTTPEMVGVSDAPWLVSWYGDRMAIWLPNDMPTLKELQRRTNVDFMLIAFYPGSSVDIRWWVDWIKRSAGAGGSLDGFDLKDGFEEPYGRARFYRSDTKYESGIESTPRP